MRIALFVFALGILAACTTEGDADFTGAYCEGQGLEAGSANFEQCVARKQERMDRNRAIQRSFRYSP